VEFDKIMIEITKLSDGRWHAIASGIKGLGGSILDTEIKNLGSVTSKDRSTLIDWFIEKVEEA